MRGIAGAPVTHAVVEAVRASLPELDFVMHDANTAPIRRQRRFRAEIFPRHGRHTLLERFTSRKNLGLVRGPGAHATQDRTSGEVRSRFLAGQPTNCAGDANLSLDLRPVKDQCRARVRGKLRALAAPIIRVKNEAVRINAFEQYDSCGRRAVCSRCGQRHCVGLRGEFCVARFGEPPVELPHRIGIDIPFRQGRTSVLLTKLGQAHARCSPATRPASAAGRADTPSRTSPGSGCARLARGDTARRRESRERSPHRESWRNRPMAAAPE